MKAKTKGKKVAAKVSKKGAKVETTARAGTTPLKKICQDLGIEPKAARVKLRRVWRREGESNLAFHSKGNRWDLAPKEASEVRAILAA